MPRARTRNAYQHVSDFDIGRIVAYQNCCSSNNSIAACVGRDPMTVGRVYNQWVKGDNTECRTGSQWPTTTSSRRRQHELSARRPLLWLTMTMHHKHERLQWFDQRITWDTKGESSLFSD
ncbi:HTH_Tnp_Tc3_2 domain-containing protein [Trichonephila clavipes]|nr:HTH_Tnp_Tc3_2 domain-containing protein [Trichonephila clavipes]